MSTEQFSVSWVSYKNTISKGFSRLQQNGEFVDMTLAAEGHLVKVHQNIVALASPYLKAMIQSVSCQHPIIFLNNINHETLGFILEYIYTGEVKIQTDLIPVFIEACKALCINGVENLVLPKKIGLQSQSEELEPIIERTLKLPDNNFAAHITINSDNTANYNVEVIPIDNATTQDQAQPIISLDDIEINYQPKIDTAVNNDNNINQKDTFPIILLDNEVIDFEPVSCPVVDREENQSKTLINSDPNTTDQNLQNVILNLRAKEMQPIARSVKTFPPSIGDKDKAQHYTISNRGSLQLLLNRYMYYCHHHSCGGHKRRWRCVDYRKLHCPAFIDTDDDNIMHRSEAHSHSYHDAKIMRKFKSKSVFTSLTQAEEKITTYKEKAPKVSVYKKRSMSEQTYFDNL